MNYKEKSNKLQEKLLKADKDLQALLPENLGNISNVSNVNGMDMVAYEEVLSRLREQIEILQREGIKTQVKLDRVLMEKEGGYRETIEKQIKSIDFESSYNRILMKLGGEFDYNGFFEEIEGFKSDFYQEISEYKLNEPKIGGLMPSEEIIWKEKIKISEKTSILDDFKRKIGYNEKMKDFIKEKFDKPETLRKFTKKTTVKPKNLLKIQTIPKKCPKDLDFIKKNDQYETIFQDKQVKSQAKKPTEYFSPVKAEIPLEKYIKIERKSPKTIEKEENNIENDKILQNNPEFLDSYLEYIKYFINPLFIFYKDFIRRTPTSY